MGIITKGMGAILKHVKKAKPKKSKLKTVYSPKEGIYIKQFKKSKKHGWKDKVGVWTNRQAAVAIEEAGKGVTMKFKKSGMPHVKTGTKPSMLTKAKGWAKLTSPVAGGITAGAVHAEIKKRKSKK